MKEFPSPGSDDPSVIRPNPPITEKTFVNISSTPVEPDLNVPVETEEELTTEAVSQEETSVEDTVDSNLDTSEDDDDEDPNAVKFPRDKVDLRGEDESVIRELMQQDIKLIGSENVAIRTRTVGTWENLVFRSLADENYEERRNQEALTQIIKADPEKPYHRLDDPTTGKAILKTSFIGGGGPTPGEVKTISGEEALLAFENFRSDKTGGNKSGGHRVVLYNSGITLDIITPTGVDVQTMITNCIRQDRELGTSQGAHYFAYADQMFKNQILAFIQPLIINSSYNEWRKRGKLWSIMKLPDLTSLVMHVAAICYPDGFDRFVSRCTRPVSETHPDLCRHEETLTVDLFKTIVTRFSIMNEDCINHLTQARVGKNKNNITQIAKYQADLGFEGEKITFGDITYTMKIPTVAEHLEEGALFLGDIVNEIEADNNDARFSEVGIRYIRTFLPWISKIEMTTSNGGVVATDDRRVIIRELERFDKDDTEDSMRKGFRAYIHKVQLTYVGYPAMKCPSCGHTPDTPSGMMTFDPFTTFFTLAFQYLNPSK